MKQFHVTFASGESRSIDPLPGRPLMEALRAAEADSVLALCGGNRSCGTCHVVVDAEFFDALPARMEEEQEMLENLPSFTPTSRLSCQLPCDKLPDGLRITVPAADL